MITNETQVQFKLCTSKSKLGTPATGDIVFIQDTKELYLDGVYYGLSTTDAATLSQAVTDITTLKSNVGDYTSITKSLVQIVTALRSFADGGVLNADGPALINASTGVLQGKTNVKAAIEALATAVNSLNAKSWTAVTKSANDPKFATAVTQSDTGQIAVTYGDAYSADIKRTSTQQNSIDGATVEAALETLKGEIDANEGDIATLNGSDSTEGSVAKAVKDAKTELKTELKGNASTDTKDSITIEGAKKYAQDLVNTLSTSLSGADSSIWETLNKVKAELQNPDDTAGLTSFLDKVTALINGFALDSTNQNYTTIKNYIDGIKSALETSISTLSGVAVKSVNGETPDANGAVTIDGADIIVTNYSKTGTGTTGNVAATDTVNKAIAKVENKADNAQTTANTAVSNAAAAQADATAALTQLKWTVIS